MNYANSALPLWVTIPLAIGFIITAALWIIIHRSKD